MCVDNFTDQVADMICQTMGLKDAISWESREAMPNVVIGVYLEKCSDNPPTFGGCVFQEGSCSLVGKKVYLHCRGM